MEAENSEDFEFQLSKRNKKEFNQNSIGKFKAQEITTSPGSSKGCNQVKKISLVDPLSQKIVSNLARIPKVEERLLSAGEDVIKSRERRLKKLEDEIKKDSIPKLIKSTYAKKYNK